MEQFVGICWGQNTFDPNIIPFDMNEVKVSDKNGVKLISNETGKLIVIDNADILLDDDTRKYISLDDKNQYLIIGRNTITVYFRNRWCILRKHSLFLILF